MEGNLHMLEECVVAIAKSSIFPMRGARPGCYDYEKLCSPFDSIQMLKAFRANVKCQVLNYLVFLTWWTVSVTEWDLHIPQDIVKTIANLQLSRYEKRGILVDLEKDWHQISIPHLLYHRVPIYYRWMETLEADERFLTLYPTILHAFQSKHGVTTDGKVFTVNMSEFAPQFKRMKDYDEFFQQRVFDGLQAEVLTFDKDWHYTVVDFQGWMYRPISITTTLEFAERFGSHIVQRGSQTSVIFWRWEALTNEASIVWSARAGLNTNEEVVRGSMEIQEIHRSFHTPVQNQKFDLNGFPD